MVAGAAALAWLDDLRASPGQAVPILLVMSAAYAVLVYLAFRGAGSLPVLVLAGVAARALLLIPDEGLSDDLYRYLWEGRVLVAGENPYQHAPDAEALAALRDDATWPRVTHKDVPAAYPPAALAVFAAVDVVHATPRAIRLVMVIADLLTWWGLVLLLRARRLDARRSVVWGLSPLVLVEFAASGHVDALAVMLCVFAFLLSVRGARSRSLAGACALGMAALVKPFALILLPFLVSMNHRRIALQQSAMCLVTVVLGFCSIGVGQVVDGTAFQGLGRYALHWSHNAPLYSVATKCAVVAKSWLESTLESVTTDQRLRDLAYDLDPNLLARGALLSCLAIIVIVLLAQVNRTRRFRRDAAESNASLALASMLLLWPTVHPWYLTWFIPFLAVHLRTPLLLWTMTVPLSYHVLAEYVPVLLWLSVDAIRRFAAPGSGAGAGT